MKSAQTQILTLFTQVSHTHTHTHFKWLVDLRDCSRCYGVTALKQLPLFIQQQIRELHCEKYRLLA